jgi:hypothetical protein
MHEAKDWASEQLATADFGDVRRVWRCQQMLRRVAERPAGRLTEVFTTPSELQGAYDFVRGSVASQRLVDAFAQATLRACRDEWLYVVVDGSSLSLTDRAKTKDFGSIGKRAFPTRGIKVLTALAVEPNGATLGLVDQQYWARPRRSRLSRFFRRATKRTETQRWVETIERAAGRVRAAGVRPWLVIDREGDCGEVLRAAQATDSWFTVRVAQDRPLRTSGTKRWFLKEFMQRRPVLGRHFVAVPANSTRSARIAKLDVRFATVELDLPDHATGSRTSLRVHVVWAHERTPPRGQDPLDWMLVTNRCIESYADIVQVLESYEHRWRIEDFHRSWKTGCCSVEDTQLQRREHVIRWAIMLAAVAARAERLKHLARTEPNAPATIELTEMEVAALRVVKRKYCSKRNEVVPDSMPTIETAVTWIAQYGGYTGKSSGGPPGSRTIARGLERLLPFAQGFALAMEMARK